MTFTLTANSGGADVGAISIVKATIRKSPIAIRGLIMNSCDATTLLRVISLRSSSIVEGTTTSAIMVSFGNPSETDLWKRSSKDCFLLQLNLVGTTI